MRPPNARSGNPLPQFLTVSLSCPSGYAFITFKDDRDAADAIRGLDRTNLEGQMIRVELTRGEPRGDRDRGGDRDRDRRDEPRGRDEGRGRDRDREEPTCFACKAKGHWARDCPEPGNRDLCFNCLEPGHRNMVRPTTKKAKNSENQINENNRWLWLPLCYRIAPSPVVMPNRSGPGTPRGVAAQPTTRVGATSIVRDRHPPVVSIARRLVTVRLHVTSAGPHRRGGTKANLSACHHCENINLIMYF